MEKLIKSIATLGPIGYLPAPGTCGSLVALPVVYFLSFLPFDEQAAIVAIVHLFAFFIIAQTLKYFRQSDPSEIVLDEVAGCLVTFVGIGWHPINILGGFILFRLFDIYKPFGIRYFEKLPGAWGVLLDDTIAGLFANLVWPLLLRIVCLILGLILVL